MNDIEETLREIFGDSFSKLSQFQRDQMGKVTTKLHEIAREGVREELGKLSAEVADLRSRVALLEAERVEKAAEQV